jgi:hypothetical protein
LTAQDTSLVKHMHEHLDDAQKQEVLSSIGKRNPTAAASLQMRFVALDQEARDDAAEMAKLVQEATGANPMADAAGDPKVPALGKGKPEDAAAVPVDDPDVIDIEIQRPHGLGVKRARIVVDDLFAGLADSVPVESMWSGDNLVLTGKEGMVRGARGVVRVSQDAIIIRIGGLPGPARLMRNAAEKAIQDRLASLLSAVE